MAETLIILLAYHVLFFRRQYLEPFRNSTGELLSTHFPHWVWMGRQLRRCKLPFKDDIYYYQPAAIPFLSTFYPPHWIAAWATKTGADTSFKVLHYLILAHYILASWLAYSMCRQWWSHEVALFGALTLTYMGAAQRIQNPCIAYTMAWVPGCFISGGLGVLSFGMAILAGYWPVLVYMAPWIALNNPWALCGVTLGLPQIIPFASYWPKSIRHGQKPPKNFGAVPWWRFLQAPVIGYRGYIRGVLFFESVVSFGLVPLFALFSTSRAWAIVLFSAVMASGLLPVPFRVPARFMYPFAFFATWMACSGLSNLGLDYSTLWIILLVQGVILLRNATLYPLWPFTEWQKKPSEWFEKETYDANVFPYFTGYFHERRTKGYTGGFSLRSTCRRNGITNPLGERV